MPAKNNFLLYILAIAANLILSYSMLLYHQPFNVDGIIYLNAAKAYLETGLHAALHIYPWPFYSVLIAKLSQISHLSLLNSAFGLNAFFSSVLICFYLFIIKKLGGGHREQWWGLVLMVVYPYLNHDRVNILRDFGYYAFFMMSLWFFIKFSQGKKIQDGFFWQVSLMIAAAFRIEGGVLLILAPFAFLCFSYQLPLREKITAYFKLSGLSLILLLSVSLFFSSLDHFGRLPELFSHLNFLGFFPLFQEKIILAQKMLGALGENQAPVFLFSGLTGVFFATLMNTLGLFTSFWLIFYIIYTRKFFLLDINACKSLFIYGLIITATLGGFLLQQLFLTGRYIFPLVLLLMLCLPFVFSYFWATKKSVWRILLILFLLVNIAASFGQFGTSKSYLVKAGLWLSHNTPLNTDVYTNDPQLAYYVNRSGTHYPEDFSDKNWWGNLQKQNIYSHKNYQYFAIVLKHQETMPTPEQVILFMRRQPIKVFQNRRGDKAYIFQAFQNFQTFPTSAIKN